MYRRLKGLSTNVGETFKTSKEFKYLIFTSLINVLHPFPGFEYNFVDTKEGFEQRYSVSTLLANVMLLRVYLALRLIPHISKWTDIHAEDCCEREGIQATSMFALKSLLKEKPYTMLFINFSISIVIFGLSVRNFERAYYEDNDFSMIQLGDENY